MNSPTPTNWTPCHICGGQPVYGLRTDLDPIAHEFSHCGYAANGETLENGVANWTASMAYLAAMNQQEGMVMPSGTTVMEVRDVVSRVEDTGLVVDRVNGGFKEREPQCQECSATGGGHAAKCALTAAPQAITRAQWLRILDAYGHMRDENVTGAIKVPRTHEITEIRVGPDGDVAGIVLEDGSHLVGYSRVEMMTNPETGESIVMAQFHNERGVAVVGPDGKPLDMEKEAEQQDQRRNAQAVAALKAVGVPDKVIVDLSRKRGGPLIHPDRGGPLVGADGKPIR